MNAKFSRRTILAAGAVAAAELLTSQPVRAAETTAEKTRRVVVWSENTAPKKVYPHDINAAVAEGLAPLKDKGWEIVTASIGDPEQGVPPASLNKTDVLMWWGHQRHGQVTDEHVQQIVKRVKNGGMGFIALHSAHFSKALKALLGTNCGWKGGYVEDGSKLEMIVQDKEHPIAKGIHDFSIPHTERYTEPFECPKPDAVVFGGIYIRPDGSKEESRQGLAWNIGKGRVFYFQPGHETYPIFFDANIRKLLCNAVEWAGGKP
jgi:trehalose utilization protein